VVRADDERRRVLVVVRPDHPVAEQGRDGVLVDVPSGASASISWSVLMDQCRQLAVPAAAADRRSDAVNGGH